MCRLCWCHSPAGVVVVVLAVLALPFVIVVAAVRDEPRRAELYPALLLADVVGFFLFVLCFCCGMDLHSACVRWSLRKQGVVRVEEFPPGGV